MTIEPIINAKFKKFRESYGLNSMTDGDAFERFVNSAILTSHQPDAFSADAELLDSICVGGQADTGIDGVAVKINGILVKSKEEASELIQKAKRADIEFVFIQSKFKPHFDSHELNIFIAGVRNFLSNSPTLPVNDKINHYITLKDYLLSDEVVYDWENNPSVRMYYVAMGKWRDEPLHLALADKGKEDIKSLNTYEVIELHFVDSEYFKRILDNNENKFTTIIETIDNMELTSVDGVDNSCIALCSAEEFSNMLTTEDGLIRKSLFDDNVRDYQGENNVNTEIFDTIIKDPAKFVLLNNGITIVCDEFVPNNRKLKITNPQIVNGCQTCNVIFSALQKKYPLSNVPVIVRVISTKNSDITNQIVRGTNRQNIVLDEAFEATKEFHKNLEQFFISFEGGLSSKIYYERRSKQYAGNPTIKQTQKINLRILTQYFVAMFLNVPHKSFRHESLLLREYGDVLFQDNQSLLPYYIASYTFTYLETLFRERLFHPELRSFKAHLLMMFRQHVAGNSPSMSSERAIDEHSRMIVEVLKNNSLAQQKFELVATLMHSCMHSWVHEMKRSRFAMKDIPEFTEFLLLRTRESSQTPLPLDSLEVQQTFRGVVIKTLIDRNGQKCGFIKKYPDNVFFHSKICNNLDFTSLEGKVVDYKIKISSIDNRPRAEDIVIIPQIGA
jgi:hypothetical protein